MFVYIPDCGGGTPRLYSADDLGALSVRMEASPADWDALARTLRAAAAGEVADGYVWLDISWLRDAAGESAPEWRDGFARMLDYAGAHGWRSADGRRLRAHVDWGMSAGDPVPRRYEQSTRRT